MDSLDDSLRVAAKAADRAVAAAMKKYNNTGVTDEDDLTGVLVGRLDAALDHQIGGLQWSASILRHRKGSAAEEKLVGADLLIHVSIETSTLKYSKGVLAQAKRVEPSDRLNAAEHSELINQCRKMLKISPASFVFDYAKSGMRCASATRVAGSSERHLHSVCNVTPFRFFFELFRCPIGDPSIKSALFSELNVRHGISLTARGPDIPIKPNSDES
jgi:hypothetical protein